MSQPVSLMLPDGSRIAGQWALPPRVTGRTVVIAGGLGIAQRFYRHFAAWLAERGHPVLTFDLRGIGDSRERGQVLRRVKADMLDWARQDFASAVAHAAQREDDGRVVVVGHSLGTHHALMTDPTTQERIAKLVSVAAGSGHWRDWHPASARRAPWMLHLAGPLLIPLLGWFPGRRLGMVGDLPGPAARQWMRWCRHRQFAWGAEPDQVLPSLRNARFVVDAFSFTDDEAMTEACTRHLLTAAPNLAARITRIAPADVGLAAIGHVGAFRPEAKNQLWPRLARSLVEGLPSQLT